MQHPPFNNQNNIPEDLKVVICVRQSAAPSQVASEHQRNIDDLVTFAKTLGFSDEHIVLIDEVQCPMFAGICKEIQENGVKVLLIQREEDLFRGTEGTDVSQFIALCQQYGVCVITPKEVYHFTNNVDCMRFRLQVEQTQYIIQYMTAHLLNHKQRVALAGYYDGRPVPVGYIVDRRRSVNSQPNPTYKKLIPYEPHAEIIRYLFHQYVECSGDIDNLCRQLPSIPVMFPLFAEWVDPLNVSKILLKQEDNGYVLTRDGLARLLRDPNPVYIGIWVYKDNNLTNNHEAIVPLEIFRQVQAFSPKYQHYLREQTQDDQSAE
jgi:DNA invertase Pin-like site-specific DNA recombinase